MGKRLSDPGMRSFCFRRCCLTETISIKELEEQFISINYYLNGKRFDYTDGNKLSLQGVAFPMKVR